MCAVYTVEVVAISALCLRVCFSEILEEARHLGFLTNFLPVSAGDIYSVTADSLEECCVRSTSPCGSAGRYKYTLQHEGRGGWG